MQFLDFGEIKCSENDLRRRIYNNKGISKRSLPLQFYLEVNKTCHA